MSTGGSDLWLWRPLLTPSWVEHCLPLSSPRLRLPATGTTTAAACTAPWTRPATTPRRSPTTWSRSWALAMTTAPARCCLSGSSATRGAATGGRTGTCCCKLPRAHPAACARLHRRPTSWRVSGGGVQRGRASLCTRGGRWAKRSTAMHGMPTGFVFAPAVFLPPEPDRQ